MNMQLVNEITKSQIKTDVPQFKAGDTLKVFVKIQEGNKTRLQMFEGVCIAKKARSIPARSRRRKSFRNTNTRVCCWTVCCDDKM